MANTPVQSQNTSPQAAPSPAAQKNKPHTDPYFVSVSRTFRAAKQISILSLVAFLIFSFTFLRNDITLENLRYLLKFISFTNTETSISAAKISYSSGDPNRFELFVGDLCTLTQNSYALYDSRGNQIMTEDVSYNDPVLKVSEKFTLCYDLGGSTFKLFNTFTKLYEDTTEYPITDGAICDTGSFAIGSSSRDYHTAVTVYDSDFSPSVRILRKDRLTALEYKPDGSSVALMTFGVRDGDFYSTIEVIVPGEDSARYKTELPSLGYSLYQTGKGYCAVTDRGLCFFDDGLNLISETAHPSQIVMTESIGDHFAALYSGGLINNSYTAVLYDTKGNAVYSGTLDGKPIAIDGDEDEDYVFFLTGTNLTRINLINKKISQSQVPADAVDMLCQSPSSVLIAFENYALTYELDDLSESYYDTDAESGTNAQTTEESAPEA